MSHQDRKSKTRIVVNHESLKQAVSELFATETFRQIKARRGSRWTARMLVTVALFWAWSGWTAMGCDEGVVGLMGRGASVSSDSQRTQCH